MRNSHGSDASSSVVNIATWNSYAGDGYYAKFNIRDKKYIYFKLGLDHRLKFGALGGLIGIVIGGYDVARRLVRLYLITLEQKGGHYERLGTSMCEQVFWEEGSSIAVGYSGAREAIEEWWTELKARLWPIMKIG
ncbi:hypothetical protein BDV96DRAFT_646552 [Lophiotrema nucula]|uniref:Uncharacterized protein n=1 Tax=Lophiotrema nucula TaxID=690887 RepID=A0A6A5ZAT8_9PLEO|nr:hypothetical protein BDV96DRAFT_646552 [Lophiotrema nucula]